MPQELKPDLQPGNQDPASLVAQQKKKKEERKKEKKEQYNIKEFKTK